MKHQIAKTQEVAKAGTNVKIGVINKVRKQKSLKNNAHRPVLALDSIPTALSKMAVAVEVPIMSAPIVATESLIKALSRFGMWPFFCMKPALNDNPINVDILSKRSTIVMENKTPTMPIVIMLLKSNWKMVSVGKNLKLLENRSFKPSNGVAPKINNSESSN